MNDAELKALINTPQSFADLKAGDYVRVDGLRYAFRPQRYKNLGAVLRVTEAGRGSVISTERAPYNALQRWAENQVVPASRAEYVAYCESVGKAVDSHDE